MIQSYNFEERKMTCNVLTRRAIHLSDRNTKIPPSAKPIATGTNAYFPSFPYVPDFSAMSIPGAINDQNDAATIT